MKDKAGSMITGKQLIFLIIGTQVDIGMFALPRLASAQAGQDAWMAVPLGAIVPLLSFYLIERLGRRMPEMGFTQMSQALFGRIIGSCLIVIFAVYIIFFGSIEIRIFSEITKLFLLPQTPLKVVVFMFTFIIVYIGCMGARVIGRLNEILFYILLLVFLVLLIPVGHSDYTNLLPIGEAGLGGIAKGAITTSYAYLGTEILLVFYTLTTKKEDILKAGITAISITMVIYLAMVITCELVFGVESMQHIIWPGLMLLKVTQVPVFERLEFIFLLFFMATGIRPALNLGFAASLSLSQFLKKDIKKYFPFFMMMIGLGMYILALLPHDVLIALQMANYIGQAYLLIGLGYPLLFHMMLFLRGGKVAENA